MKNHSKRLSSSGDEVVNIGEKIAYYLKYWWVILIGMLLFSGLGMLFLHIKSPVYQADAKIIINDNDDDSGGRIGGALSSLAASFSMGGSSAKAPADELFKIQSHTALTETSRRLNLHKIYRHKDGLLSPSIWYYNNSPLEIETPVGMLDTISATTTFKIKVRDGGKSIHVKVRQGKVRNAFEGDFKSLPILVKTRLGSFKIVSTKYFNPSQDLNFQAVVMNPEIRANDLYEKLTPFVTTKKSNVILFTMEDVVPERAKDIVNTVIDIYNEESVSDNQNAAQRSVQFIEERLVKLYKEIEDSQDKIATYKRENQIVDAEAEAEYIFKKKETVEGSLVELQTRAGVLRMILEFIKDNDNKYSLIPFSTDAPEQPVSAYNELVLERMKLQTNVKGNNAALKTVTEQVDAMRVNLIKSLESNLKATNIAIADMDKVSNSSKTRMQDVPTMEKDLIGLYRDQTIKNNIYSYLLMKREENELKMSNTTPVSKIIDSAYLEEDPISPNKPVIYILSAFIGALCACGLLYLKKDKLTSKSFIGDKE
jgi:uncharacterized protein involved in exopolysaccharide biosynthesis